MSINDTSTAVLDDYRVSDAIVNTKDSSDDANVVHQTSDTDAAATTGKHVVFNEDEEDLKSENVTENALGDVTNHHDGSMGRKELKPQRSRSALIFDEIDEVQGKTHVLLTENALDGVPTKDDDMPVCLALCS